MYTTSMTKPNKLIFLLTQKHVEELTNVSLTKGTAQIIIAAVQLSRRI